MARVYVSSTRRDLEHERRLVLEWLANHGHERRHSYVADSETVRDSCARDVLECDAYVLILGHRYGHVPDDSNPLALSITELEYDAAAGKDGMPVIVMKPTYIRTVGETDIGRPAYMQVLAFQGKVAGKHRAAEFDSDAALIDALDLALDRALAPPQERQDVQAILHELTRVSRESGQKDAQLESMRREIAELQTQLAAAVARTIDAAEAPNASPAQVEAADALRAGDTGPAGALLREGELAAAEQIGQASTAEDEAAARKRAAKLARERGALALQTDVAIALEAYSEAAKHDPDDVWTWLSLGDMQKAAGDLDAALASYRQAHDRAAQETVAAPDTSDAARDLSISHIKLGDVLVAQGDLPAALEAFEASLAITGRLAARDPEKALWQHDLSLSHERRGKVRVAQDDLPAALEAFQASLAIRARLAVRDAENTNWQRELAVSHDKLGDVRVAQGDLPAAREAFDASLAIRARLAAGDPANTLWQHDLSVSHQMLGSVHVAQGDLQAAREAFELSLAITARLVARDPANTLWQRDLSVSHDKLGEVRVAQADLPAAREAFAASLAISEGLAARDASNVEWRVDLAVSYFKLAGLLETPRQERRDLLRKGLTILEELAAAGRLPPNQDWRPWFNGELRKLDEPGPATVAG